MATSSSHGSPESTRPATSADVAKRAGVSRATVSYILNGKAGVSFTAETREAVIRAARELSYQPNAAARSLVGRSGPVVLVMSHLPHNEVTSAAVGVISMELAHRGVLTTVLQVADDIDATVTAIASLNPRAALLAFPAGGELASALTKAGVVVAALAPEPDQTYSMGRLQVGHLGSRGHSQLAFADVVGSHRFGVLPRRAEVIEACRDAGLPEPLADEVARNGDGVTETVARWHRAGVTAVCAYNDEVALAVLHGIREAGLRCPEDVAVIGCDDIPAAAVAHPTLTTVAFNVDQDASWIVGAILHQLGLAEAPAAPPVPLLSITHRASA